MKQVIALDATTGLWTNVGNVSDKNADSMVAQMADRSDAMGSPWIFFHMPTTSGSEELEARVDQCMEAYVNLGGRAAVE